MRNSFITLLSLLLCLNVNGQQSQQGYQIPEIIPPSPTVASLMRFEEVPVDLYSGAPQISIPMFSKALDGGLGINVALSYNPSGIRVEERASPTGKGWNLIAGGSISRTVMDLPDNINDFNTGRYGVWHNGFFNFENMTQAAKEEFLFYTQAGNKRYDSQIDVFQYNFMGKTGRFSIIESQGGTLEAVPLSEGERLQIDYSLDAFGRISSYRFKRL